jgi:hypothetical protein
LYCSKVYPTSPAFFLGAPTKRTNVMSKAGEKRTLDGGDEDKPPFTDEQLVALEEPNKGGSRINQVNVCA